jgi:hypothetical protein
MHQQHIAICDTQLMQLPNELSLADSGTLSHERRLGAVQMPM